MIKRIITILISFIVLYLCFAFVSWDLMWVTGEYDRISFARVMYCAASLGFGLICSME